MDIIPAVLVGGTAILVGYSLYRWIALIRRSPSGIGNGGGPITPAPPRAAPRVSRETMSILVTLVLLLAGLWVILSENYSSDTEKWAFGCVGAIIGMWLTPPS